MSEAVKRGRAIGACRSSSSGDTDITWTSGSTARTAARIAAAVSASGALVRTAIDCAATMSCSAGTYNTGRCAVSSR